MILNNFVKKNLVVFFRIFDILDVSCMEESLSSACFHDEILCRNVLYKDIMFSTFFLLVIKILKVWSF